MPRDDIDETADFHPDPPRRSSATPWLLAFLLAGGLVALLCCGGAGGVVYYGIDVFTDQVAANLRENPVIREHIGEIEDLDMNWLDSAEAEGDDEFVFHIRGTQGEGDVRLVSITRDTGAEDVVSGTLRMSSGEEYDLLPAEDEAQ